MKKLALLIIFVSSLISTEIFTDYKEALKYAKGTQKNLYVIVEQKNCPWCVKFHKSVASPQVQEILEGKFVTVFLDKHNNLPSQFNTPIAPVSFIVENDGEIYYEMIGYLSAERVVKEFKMAYEDFED